MEVLTSVVSLHTALDTRAGREVKVVAVLVVSATHLRNLHGDLGHSYDHLAIEDIETMLSALDQSSSMF